MGGSKRNFHTVNFTIYNVSKCLTVLYAASRMHQIDYHSRPGRCRDYPRNLLTAPRPQFFSECSYFAVDRNAERYRRALERFPITEEKREELFERLYLIEK